MCVGGGGGGDLRATNIDNKLYRSTDDIAIVQTIGKILGIGIETNWN